MTVDFKSPFLHGLVASFCPGQKLRRTRMWTLFAVGFATQVSSLVHSRSLWSVLR